MANRLNIVYDDELHLYKVNGEHVVSVTQVLEETLPKQLTYWGYRIGIAATKHLIDNLSWPALMEMDPVALEEEIRAYEAGDKTLELSPNRVRDSAATDGTAIHTAIKQYHDNGELPDFDDFDPELRGFVQAFSQFVLEQDAEVLEYELIVAHGDQMYAGRPDMLAKFGERGIGLIDFKTSRRTKHTKTKGTEPVFEVYNQMHAQLRLYEDAYNWTESFHGNEPMKIDFRAIVFLHQMGKYSMLPAVQADWAPGLVQTWYGLHEDGLIKAPWEKDPKRRAAGLKRSNAAPAR